MDGWIKTAMYKKLTIITILLTPVLFWLAYHAYSVKGTPSTPARPSQPKDAPPPGRLKGTIVYERGNAIYFQKVSSRNPIMLTMKGRYPRWSPDGRYVTFLRGNKVMRIHTASRKEQVLATAAKGRALAYHPDGSQVLFTDHKTIKAVNIKTGKVRLIARGHLFREVDITGDGSRMVTSVKWLGYHVRAYDLKSGKDWKVSKGCSASLNPAGDRITNNLSGHKKLALRNWSDGKIKKIINAPKDAKFDNQFWSNHPNWIASQTEGEQANIYIHDVSANRAYQVTRTGDCSRPDLFVN